MQNTSVEELGVTSVSEAVVDAAVTFFLDFFFTSLSAVVPSAVAAASASAFFFLDPAVDRFLTTASASLAAAALASSIDELERSSEMASLDAFLTDDGFFLFLTGEMSMWSPVAATASMSAAFSTLLSLDLTDLFLTGEEGGVPTTTLVPLAVVDVDVDLLLSSGDEAVLLLLLLLLLPLVLLVLAVDTSLPGEATSESCCGGGSWFTTTSTTAVAMTTDDDVVGLVWLLFSLELAHQTRGGAGGAFAQKGCCRKQPIKITGKKKRERDEEWD